MSLLYREFCQKLNSQCPIKDKTKCRSTIHIESITRGYEFLFLEKKFFLISKEMVNISPEDQKRAKLPDKIMYLTVKDEEGKYYLSYLTDIKIDDWELNTAKLLSGGNTRITYQIGDGTIIYNDNLKILKIKDADEKKQ